MRFLSSHELESRGTFAFPMERYAVNSSHPRYEMPFHWHMESEIIRICKGEFHLSLDGNIQKLSSGDLSFIPGGIIHGGTPQGSGCVYECLVFDMERFLKYSAVCQNSCHTVLNHEMQIQSRFSPGTDAGTILTRLFETVKRKKDGYEFIATGLLWQFIGTVLEQHLYTERKENRLEKNNDKIKNVLLRIRDDYAKPLTLKQLADETGLTPQYFCRAFRQITGRTPFDYLNYYRINCAAELLCSTEDSVTDISLSCGFNDLSYFLRMFRRYKGISAGKYRKQFLAASRPD